MHNNGDPVFYQDNGYYMSGERVPNMVAHQALIEHYEAYPEDYEDDKEYINGLYLDKEALL